MYHQDKEIWSSQKAEEFQGRGSLLCGLSLQKDGNLRLFKENWKCFLSHSGLVMYYLWESDTSFHPKQTELRIQDQQLQIVQTFEDGSERMFCTGKGVRGFQADLGPPKQIAKEFLIVNHTEIYDNVILKRNEYIGNINAIHLILQTNCDLQLKDNTRVIWSFAAYFAHGENCTLKFQEGNSIGISEIPQSPGMKILPGHGFEVLQSQITFQEDQLFIIQTLNNGFEITFYSEPGQDNGLKFQKKLRQIAKNKITIFDDDKDDSNSDEGLFTLERLDYIGDLDGLHLILRDNCVLTLANGQQELWKLTKNVEKPYKRIKDIEGPFMECFIIFDVESIYFYRITNFEDDNFQKNGKVKVLQKLEEDEDPTKFEISLENNLMIMTFEYENRTSEIFHAGANTNGTWFQFISGSSIIVNANDTDDLFIPNMGYIGDIHGVYTLLDKRGNWILFNNTQVIWESKTTKRHEYKLDLILTRDGNVGMNFQGERDKHVWSTKNQTTSISPQAELSKTELLVNHGGMWLIKTFVDGIVDKYKALEGTNQLVLMPNEYEFINI